MFTHKVQRKILCKKCNTTREQPESIFDFILHFN